MLREELIIKNTAVKELQKIASTGNLPTEKLPEKPAEKPVEKPIEYRTWTDVTGKFTVLAKLVRQSETSVTLMTETGRELTLPAAKLSQADLDFLKSTTNSDKN